MLVFGLKRNRQPARHTRPPIKLTTEQADEKSRDVLLVLATPGWITGQSYMISAALLCAGTHLIAFLIAT